MIRGAVQQYEKENRNNQSKTPSRSLFTSSSSTQTAQQGIPAKVPFDSALKPAASSALNSQKSHQPQNASGQGVKRMSNGLAKALCASFGDESATQPRQTPLDLGLSQAHHLLDNEIIDEDDFDSDIDLDFEAPKAGVDYPQLPQGDSTSTAPRPVVYPSLARQQQLQTAYEEPSHDVADPREPLPRSSAPLPWSSSPARHFEPSLDPSIIKSFVYGASDAPEGRQDALGQPKTTGRRTLPWLKDDAGQSAARSVTSKSKPSLDPLSTPAPKASKKSLYQWTTTASAIKEQRKSHREEVRKVVKTNEETMDVAKAKTQRKKVPRVFLSEEQQHVLDLVVEQKKSVFFTGSAGTGKSVLLREIISSLRKKFARDAERVAVTASTGLAACNVGGVTLHSFAGIGLGKEDVPELVRKIKRNQKAKHRWMKTKILVIDEVSMVDAELFDKLEAVARQLRNNGRPFGGIQLIITGDFFQLPPVPENGRAAKFAFDAATWNTTIEHTIGLHHVFRQKDPVFAGMLNEMREGRLTDSSVKAFRNLSRNLTFEDAIDATELFPLRSEVERANHDRLTMLQGEAYMFDSRDGGSILDENQRGKLLQNCMAPQSITLKKGAQVMLIKNVDEHLVNGSIGRVIAFMDESEFDKFRINEDAYSQRADGVFVSQAGEEMSKEERAVKRLNQNLNTSRKFPLVRFTTADGSSRDLLCQPENWKVELPNGEVQASRTQVPLILAWALSIHKAQGQTLERVKVDLGKVFEKGQAYVALSRATSMAGLQVLRFDPKKVNAHDRVRTFYANLARVALAEGAGGKALADVKKKAGAVPAEDYEKWFLEEAEAGF